MDGGIGRHLPARIPDGTTSRMPAGDLHCTKFKQAILYIKKIKRHPGFTSLVWLANQPGPVIRSHWAIENSLHWVMDMIFRDDECRIREHAPANFTTLKHMAHNLIRKAPGKPSFRAKRKITAWDDDFLASLIAA
jgi:predicted transposase YbfD/YdcC